MGLGDNICEQKTPISIPGLSGKKVCKISVGEFHAAAVTSKGDILIWGENKDNILGSGFSGVVWTPKPVQKMEIIFVSNIVCGSNCTYALSSDGDIYSWGIGRHGVLGHGNEDNQLYPKQISSLKKVVGIASGGMHVVAWIDTGVVYSWGWGRDYKLGLKDDEDRFCPTQVTSLSRGKIVVSVTCGFDRTVALLETDLINVIYGKRSQSFAVLPDMIVSDILKSIVEHFKINPPNVLLIDEFGQEVLIKKNIRQYISRSGSNKFIVIHRTSLWEEASDELYFKEIKSEENLYSIPTVDKATVENLIMWLTHHSSTGFHFANIFLLMHPNFLSHSEFLNKLIERYNFPKLPSSLHETMIKDCRRIIQLRVINILRKWIQGSYIDVMQEDDIHLVEQIDKFIEHDISLEHPREATGLRRLLMNKLNITEWVTSEINIDNFSFNDKAPKPCLHEHNGEIDLFKYPPIEFARHLTAIDFYYFFQKIHPREFVNLAWTKSNKEEKSPNIVAMIKRFNNISEWCVAEILRGESHQIRVLKTQRFIEIAEELLKLHNLNSVLSILSSFNTAAIHRLRIWNDKIGVSVKHQESLARMRDIISVDNNMTNYREYFDPLSTPKVPFLGIYLQDLNFLYDANPNTDQKNPKLINFTKWIKLGSIVEQIVNLQQSPYNLQPIKPLLDYLLAACGFENHETSAYKFSKLIEPDNQIDQKHNFSQTFSPRVLSVQLAAAANANLPAQIISPRPASNGNVAPPNSLSKTFRELYNLTNSDRASQYEDPEIRLINQKAKIVLSNFKLTMDIDRSKFWKIILDKLNSSSSKRPLAKSYTTSMTDLHQMDKQRLSRIISTVSVAQDRMNFREILCKSYVIEYSIDSALICFPTQSDDQKLLHSLLKATLRTYIPINKLLELIEELSKFQLTENHRKTIISMISCYKDFDIQAKHNRLSSAVREMNRLSLLATSSTVLQNQLLSSEFSLDTILKEINFRAELIQNLNIQQKLLQNKYGEYQLLIEKYNENSLNELSNFIDELSQNTSSRIDKIQNEKREQGVKFESGLFDIQRVIDQEMQRIADLKMEEQLIMKEIEYLDRKIEKAEIISNVFRFFHENAQLRAEVTKTTLENQIKSLESVHSSPSSFPSFLSSIFLFSDYFLFHSFPFSFLPCPPLLSPLSIYFPILPTTHSNFFSLRHPFLYSPSTTNGILCQF